MRTSAPVRGISTGDEVRESFADLADRPQVRADAVQIPLFDDAASGPEAGSPALAQVPAFFRIRDVLRITALSRPTIYRRIAAGRFPAPVHLGGRTCAWSRVALQAWINDPDNYRASDTRDALARRPRGRPRKYAAR